MSSAILKSNEQHFLQGLYNAIGHSEGTGAVGKPISPPDQQYQHLYPVLEHCTQIPKSLSEVFSTESCLKSSFATEPH